MAPGQLNERADPHPHGRPDGPPPQPPPATTPTPTPAPAPALSPTAAPTPTLASQPPPPPPAPTPTYSATSTSVSSSITSHHPSLSRSLKSTTTTLTVTPSASTIVLVEPQETSSAPAKGPQYALLVALPLIIILFLGMAVCGLAIYYRRNHHRATDKQGEAQNLKPNKWPITSSIRSSDGSSLKSPSSHIVSGPNPLSLHSEKPQVQMSELEKTSPPPPTPPPLNPNRFRAPSRLQFPIEPQISQMPESPSSFYELSVSRRPNSPFGPPQSPPPREPPPRPPRPLNEWVPDTLRISDTSSGSRRGNGFAAF